MGILIEQDRISPKTEEGWLTNKPSPLPEKFAEEVYPGKIEVINRGKLTYAEYLEKSGQRKPKKIYR